jgi:hypothetical protein
MREVLCSRWVQLAAQTTLSIAIIAMFLGMHESTGSGHSAVWDVVTVGGFALAVVSLPARTYGLYVRSRRAKAAAHDKGGG